MVLMNFMDRPGGWHVAFLEADCQTSLPVKLTFQSAEKIRIMQQRLDRRFWKTGKLWSMG